MKIREGPIISDKPRPPLRGLSFPQNDQRPGLPTPGPRAFQPGTYNSMGTTSSDGNANIQGLNPEDSRAGIVRIQTGPTGKPYAVGGTTPTQTGGFGKNTVSGTGLQDQKIVTSPKPAPWWMLKSKKEKR